MSRRFTLLFVVTLVLGCVAGCGATAEPQTMYAPQYAPAPTLAPPNDQPYHDMFFEDYGVNPSIDTEDDHLSTFALDVDTGSYTVARRYVRDGDLPPKDAIPIYYPHVGSVL
jgi:Ca-activated chloride channel family protein